MSQGRIARSHRRYSAIQRRRAVLYKRSVRARRGRGLPPHLLPGITRRRVYSNRWRWILAVASVFLVAFMAAIGSLIVSTLIAVNRTMAAYRKLSDSLPDAAALAVDNFQTSRIFDRDGNLLQEIDDPNTGWRTFVRFDQIAQVLIDATVSAEDATFWEHKGVEPLAIPRGILISVSGEGSSGGSTITQQLARALFPKQIGFDPAASLGMDLYTRKFKEAMAAIELERRYSKEDIITMYLNLIFYGERSYGIQAAAETYFQKDAKDLNLAEASMLAGIPQLPTDYDPIINYDLAKRRQRYVLDQMVKYHYIKRAEADEAFEVKLEPKTRTNAVQAFPHFVQYVKEWVSDHYGEEALVRGGLQITTSIDPTLQDRAEEILQQGVANMNVFDAHNGCMVVLVPYTGEVLAMVGSADYNDALINGQVNIATSWQQPGSSIKPIAYTAAFEAGWNPGTIVMDVPYRRRMGNGEFYEPQNYTGYSYGAVTVRTALSNSLNVPAVRAAEFSGVGAIMDVGKRMGLRFQSDNPDQYGTSIALGSAEVQPVQHTNAYATLANGGKFVEASPIVKITDSQGNVLYELDRKTVREKAPQAISAEHAYQITSILTDDQARSMVFGRGNLFEQTQKDLGRPTTAKSGTSNDWVDTWTMGYTTACMVGVWVGNTNNQPIAQKDGIESAGPIWSKMMNEMHKNPDFFKLLNGPDGRPVAEDFPRPDGIYRGDLCTATGHRPEGGGSTRTELLVRGEGPSLRCDQISEWERQQLEEAITRVNRGSARWANGSATTSIQRYADAVGVHQAGQYYRGDDQSEQNQGANG